ncbi:MAG: MarR family transcriptional regulator [Acidobacteria bacterium]|nr:MarR family transcriptional regulator [Acidobacteriota bacterium]
MQLKRAPKRRRPPRRGASGVSATRLHADTAEFYSAFLELLRVFQFRDRDRACYGDVTLTECYSLEALDRRGAMTVSDLAADLCLDKSGASRTLASLERKGYALRFDHATDRRALMIRLTSTGRAVLYRIKSDIEARYRDILSDFPPPVRREAVRLLRALTRDARATSSKTCRAPAKGKQGKR